MPKSKNLINIIFLFVNLIAITLIFSNNVKSNFFSRAMEVNDPYTNAPKAPYCSRTCGGNTYCKPDSSGGTCVQDIPVVPPTTTITPTTSVTTQTTNTSSTSNYCDANGTKYPPDSIVVGGSTGYSKCTNGKWAVCPSCGITDLSFVPAYLKTAYDKAISEKQIQPNTTVSTNTQPAKTNIVVDTTKTYPSQTCNYTCGVNYKCVQIGDGGYGCRYVQATILTGSSPTVWEEDKKGFTGLVNLAPTPKYSSTAECQKNTSPYSRAYTSCNQYTSVAENKVNIITKANDLLNSYVGYWQNVNANAPADATLLEKAFNTQTVYDTTQLVTLGKFDDYVNAYSPEKVNYTWKAKGYSSLEECQKNNVQNCNAYAPTKEQFSSSIDLGVTVTAEAYALGVAPQLIATAGAGGGVAGAVNAGLTALGQMQVVSTVYQSGQTASYCALNGWDPTCQQQLARSGISWSTLGVSQYANTTNTLFGRTANTIVSTANLAVDSGDVATAFYTNPETDNLTKAMSVVAVLGDVGGGIMDWNAGQIIGSPKVDAPTIPRIEDLTGIPKTEALSVVNKEIFSSDVADELKLAMSGATPNHEQSAVASAIGDIISGNEHMPINSDEITKLLIAKGFDEKAIDETVLSSFQNDLEANLDTFYKKGPNINTFSEEKIRMIDELTAGYGQKEFLSIKRADQVATAFVAEGKFDGQNVRKVNVDSGNSDVYTFNLEGETYYIKVTKEDASYRRYGSFTNRVTTGDISAEKAGFDFANTVNLRLDTGEEIAVMKAVIGENLKEITPDLLEKIKKAQRENFYIADQEKPNNWVLTPDGRLVLIDTEGVFNPTANDANMERFRRLQLNFEPITDGNKILYIQKPINEDFFAEFMDEKPAIKTTPINSKKLTPLENAQKDVADWVDEFLNPKPASISEVQSVTEKFKIWIDDSLIPDGQLKRIINDINNNNLTPEQADKLLQPHIFKDPNYLSATEALDVANALSSSNAVIIREITTGGNVNTLQVEYDKKMYAVKTPKSKGAFDNFGDYHVRVREGDIVFYNQIDPETLAKGQLKIDNTQNLLDVDNSPLSVQRWVEGDHPDQETLYQINRKLLDNHLVLADSYNNTNFVVDKAGNVHLIDTEGLRPVIENNLQGALLAIYGDIVSPRTNEPSVFDEFRDSPLTGTVPAPKIIVTIADINGSNTPVVDRLTAWVDDKIIKPTETLLGIKPEIQPTDIDIPNKSTPLLPTKLQDQVVNWWDEKVTKPVGDALFGKITIQADEATKNLAKYNLSWDNLKPSTEIADLSPVQTKILADAKNNGINIYILDTNDVPFRAKADFPAKNDIVFTIDSLDSQGDDFLTPLIAHELAHQRLINNNIEIYQGIPLKYNSGNEVAASLYAKYILESEYGLKPADNPTIFGDLNNKIASDMKTLQPILFVDNIQNQVVKKFDEIVTNPARNLLGGGWKWW